MTGSGGRAAASVAALRFVLVALLFSFAPDPVAASWRRVHGDAVSARAVPGWTDGDAVATSARAVPGWTDGDAVSARAVPGWTDGDAVATPPRDVPGWELPGQPSRRDERRLLVLLWDANPSGDPFRRVAQDMERRRWIVRSFALGRDRYHGSVHVYVERLASFLGRIEAARHEEWSLVAEGVSGLVARAWFAHRCTPAHRPRSFVTLGTPHKGMARPARGIAWGLARELAPDAFGLRRLAFPPPAVRLLNLWFRRDEAIVPPENAIWPRVVNRELSPGAFKHRDFLGSDVTRAELRAFLEGRSPVPVGSQR